MSSSFNVYGRFVNINRSKNVMSWFSMTENIRKVKR